MPLIKEKRMLNFGLLGAGLIVGLSTVGSGVGLWVVGQATVGAWKRCYLANKPAPTLLLVLCGMPMSQTFYGFILMLQMRPAAFANPENGLLYLGIGLAAGISNMITAISQGRISASAADALAETGKGFAQYIMVLGIAESVALFTMVFSMIAL
jgi:V/A-type H+-transporting ATPase subunit K